MQIRTLLAGLAAITFSGMASAGLAEWQTEVNGDGAGFSATNIVAPTTADIGLYDDTTNGGVTYEFIVNASNGITSSALMGARNNGVGDNGGLKWEQSSGDNLGATTFGVEDFFTSVANSPNVDTCVVFVATGTGMDLYVDGVFQTAITGGSNPSFALSGTVGIGQAFDPGGNFDPLTGTILGVAVYDSALSASDIAEHHAAYLVPEPGSLALLGLGGLALLRRRRA